MSPPTFSSEKLWINAQEVQLVGFVIEYQPRRIGCYLEQATRMNALESIATSERSDERT